MDWDKIAYLEPKNNILEKIFVRNGWQKGPVQNDLSNWLDGWITHKCHKDAMEPEAIEGDIYTIN